MATKDIFSNAWDVPRNWQVEFQVDGVCYEALPCINFGGADETPPDLSDYGCIDPTTGKLAKKGTIDNTTFTRSTTTFVTRFSDIQPLLTAQNFTEKGTECLFNGRVAVYCGFPRTKDKLLGYITLEDISLAGGKSFGQLTDAFGAGGTGGGAGTENIVTFNASISGFIDLINLASTVYVGFDATGAAEAIFQCDDAVCKSGTNLCGDAQVKRGECDNWTELENNGTGFDINLSTDGGRTYTLDQTVTAASLGLTTANVVNADCDLIVVTEAPLELCGNLYRPVANLPAFTALLDYDGGNAIIFSDGGGANGVLVFDEAQNEWFIGQTTSGTITAQNHIDSDGQVMLTGGDADGIAVGADYQYSLGAGEVGSWTRATLNIAGWSTITDSIQDTNVRDGVMTLVVENGTDTKVLTSFDGVNWTDAGDFSGVSTYVKLRRPTDEITYLVLDDIVWANYSGVCECEWVQIQDLPNTPNQFEVCSNDPTYTHYTY